jgi:hypothetical protein
MPVCAQAEGSPDSGGAGVWPQFSPSVDAYLRLDTLPNRVVISGVHSSTCDAWDAVSPAYPVGVPPIGTPLRAGALTGPSLAAAVQ